MQLGVVSAGPFSNSSCMIYQTANYSNTVAADLSFNTNPYNSAWWVVGSPTIITLPYTGFYNIYMDFSASMGAAQVQLILRVNGGNYHPFAMTLGGGANYRYTDTITLPFNANDTLAIRANPTSAGTYTVYGYSTATAINYINSVNHGGGVTGLTTKSFLLHAEFIGGGF